MSKRNIQFKFTFLFLLSIFFYKPINAGIGDKYFCEDYSATYYENQFKESRGNYKFFFQWERNKILKKYENFPNIYSMKIIQQDTSSFIAWQYDKFDNSGISINTLDESDKDNILFIRAHVDSKNKVTSSFFSKCRKI